ncbi:hypothetical protein [Streptomyces sp. NPDC056707]|uniref:hypothetical protein n=1 Tax=Streptomyces sp. NPDC056707 TaxID=3345919 RepID=UPI003683502B
MTDPTWAQAMEWMTATVRHALRWGGVLPVPVCRRQAPEACPARTEPGGVPGRHAVSVERLLAGALTP